MQNNLNTVLLEGKLKEKPSRLKDSFCMLKILSRWEDEVSEYHAVVSGDIAETCMKVLKKDSEIRIVGHLKKVNWFIDGESVEKYMIVVEHVEFMPKEG